MGDFDLLASQPLDLDSNPGHVASRMRLVRNQAYANRVVHIDADNWDVGGRLPRGQGSRRAAGHNQARLEPNQFFCQSRQAAHVAVGVARLERIVTSFQVTKLSHALWEAVMEAFTRRSRGRGEKTNERAFGWSLRPCRPRRRGGA